MFLAPTPSSCPPPPAKECDRGSADSCRQFGFFLEAVVCRPAVIFFALTLLRRVGTSGSAIIQARVLSFSTGLTATGDGPVWFQQSAPSSTTTTLGEPPRTPMAHDRRRDWRGRLAQV